MPYTSKTAPDWVKKLPAKLMDAWIKAFNAAFEEYKDDGKATATANAVLSKMAEKKDGKWVMKEGTDTKNNDRQGIKFEDFVGREKNLRLPVEMSLVEAKDDTGSTWEVQIIKAGLSKNRNYYPPEVLKEAAPLYEGARVLARSDEDHSKGTGKKVKDIVGFIDGVTWNESAQANHGTFNILENAAWMKTMLVSAFRKGKRDILGLSHVAEGTSYPKKMGGTLVNWVGKILKVNSVDVVVDPAAGGGLLKMIESENQKQLEDFQMLEKLLKLLESVAPDKVKALGDNPDQDKVLDVVRETLSAKMDTAAVDKIIEALKPKEEPEPEPEPPPPTAKSTDQDDRISRIECRAMLNEALAGSSLPREAKDAIRKQFSDDKGNVIVFQEKNLRESLESWEKVIGAFAQTHQIKGYGATVQKDEADKLQEAVDGFFLGQDVNKTPRFRSIRQLYVDITGDERFTREIKNAPGLRRFGESISQSNWDQVIGNAVNKSLMKEYAESGLDQWRKVVSIVPVSDMRAQDRTQIGGYENLGAVSEGQPYPSLTSPTDVHATYTPSKYGGIEDLTWETIVNDDVGAVQRIPRKLARAAAHTLNEFIFDTFVNNTITAPDGVVWFHAGSHVNLLTTAFSQTALIAVWVAMGKFAELSSSKRLGIKPKYLLYPIDLADAVFTALKTEKVTSSANNDVRMVSAMGIEPIQVDYWSDTNDWYCVADPRDCPGLEVGFFQGREEPELFVQDNPLSGSMFTADKTTFKIRHIYGRGLLDWRCAHRNTVG